jgi:hypothetical protein
MKRSKIDRLFRLWDALSVLRDIGFHAIDDEHHTIMRARRSIRRILESEYNVPKGMVYNNLTIGGCIYLIRKDNAK